MSTASASSASTAAPALMPSLFLSHGGGPCFFMKGGMFAEMDKDSVHADFYRKFNDQLPAKPKAIIVISGHWEEKPVKVMTTSKPPMYFDYYGFPEEAYKLSFPAPGHPELAKRVKDLLAASGIPCGEDSTRGFDHGVFVPLLLAYPKADVPVFQLSMHTSMDPALHLRMGAALAPLRQEGVLIFGSGAATHNLGAIRSSAPSSKPAPWAASFIAWLQDTLTNTTPRERINRLLDWKKAPHFRDCHPREEHLVPLLVAVGAATPGLRADPKTGAIFLDEIPDTKYSATAGTKDAAPVAEVAVAADGAAAVVAVGGSGADAAAPAPADTASALASGSKGTGKLIHKGFVMGTFAMDGYKFE